MAKHCWIDSCRRRAEAFCAHCSEELCHHHFMEHKDWLQEQLLPMIKQVNIIYSRFQRCDMDQAIFTLNCLSDARHELNQWRSACVRHIDDVYDRALQEITTTLEKRKQETVEQNKQNLDSLSKIRRQLERLLNSGKLAYEKLRIMKIQLNDLKRKETEHNNQPDIRIVTDKIDVNRFVDIIYSRKQQSEEELYREATTRVEISKRNAPQVNPSDDSDEEQRRKRRVTRTYTLKTSVPPPKVSNARITRKLTQVKRHGYQERVAYANEHTRKKIVAEE
ncbi:unnamed protein product [Adineta ricciae]|uniref:Uncharacterized protein n=1 Tax=Adineta ricciae TaxID=249248 RepID=A0A814D722_ADIRI|nr:unnamed protein product [Adineta ricciae]CAF0951901.1 unnamed protein product [Adineta ricciae]